MGNVQRGRTNGWFIQIISWRVRARGWGEGYGCTINEILFFL